LSRRPADPDSKFMAVDGLAVHYKLRGTGDPVFLLLHGFGASVFSWRKVTEPLARLGSVVAFDRPGFGLTDRPMPDRWLSGSPYGEDAYARLTAGLMDGLGIGRAILVGHSAGGELAVRVALRHPERVTGLVLEAPALKGYHYRLPHAVRWFLSTRPARMAGPRLARAMVGRLSRLIDISWHDTTKLDEETLAGYRRPLRTMNWDRALWEIIIAPKGEPMARRLGELRVPVLFVTGDDDRIVLARMTREAAAQVPGSALVVIANCGHLPHEECPAEFVAAVERFVTAQKSPQGEGFGNCPAHGIGGDSNGPAS